MWLTTKEAAKELGISVSTLKRRISKGIYPTQYEMIYKNGAGVKILKIYVEKSEVQSEVHTNKSEVQSEVHTNKSEVQSEVHTNKSEVQSEVHTNKSEVQSEVQKQSPQIQPLTLPPILSDYGPDFFIKRTSGSMRDKLIETYLNLSRDEKSQVLGYVRQFMSERTWYSWVSRYRNRGHLKRKVRADRGKSRKELPTFMQELLQAILISHPQWNVQKAYEDMKLLAVNGGVNGSRDW